MHSSFYNFFSHYPATTAISTLSLHDALPIYRRGGNHDEAVSAKDCAVGHARCASFWRCVVLEEQLHGETEQDRLLDVHNASFGARKGTREMSHLFDGYCPGHERKRHPSGLE